MGPWSSPPPETLTSAREDAAAAVLALRIDLLVERTEALGVTRTAIESSVRLWLTTLPAPLIAQEIDKALARSTGNPMAYASQVMVGHHERQIGRSGPTDELRKDNGEIFAARLVRLHGIDAMNKKK